MKNFATFNFYNKTFTDLCWKINHEKPIKHKKYYNDCDGLFFAVNISRLQMKQLYCFKRVL